jgi:HEPN domain-containing protein
MRPLEELKRELVTRWIAKAEKDFSLAEHLVAEGCFYCEAIGFNSQQSVEKLLKAVLAMHQVDFPKTHNLGELLDRLAAVDTNLADSLRELTALNPYGVEYRYPGDFPELTSQDAETAFQLARKAHTILMPMLKAFLGGGGEDLGRPVS